MTTKIKPDDLTDLFGYDIKKELRGEVASSSAAINALFDGVYDEMLMLASSDDITVKTVEDMEARLDTPEKQDWFRKAQGYQLIYEMRSGKNTMFTPDSFDTRSVAFDFCRDTLRIMRNILGFNRPTLFTRR